MEDCDHTDRTRSVTGKIILRFPVLGLALGSHLASRLEEDAGGLYISNFKQMQSWKEWSM